MFKKYWRFYNTLVYLGFFSPVFAFFSFLNKDRLGIEVSYCLEQINTIFSNGEII